MVNATCNGYPVSEEMAEVYIHAHYSVGIVGCSVLSVLCMLILYRIYFHVKYKSRFERVLFHVLLLCSALLEFCHTFMKCYAKLDWCFVFQHIQYTWAVHICSSSLQFLALLITIVSWSKLLQHGAKRQWRTLEITKMLRSSWVLPLCTIVYLGQMSFTVAVMYEAFDCATDYELRKLSRNSTQYIVLVAGTVLLSFAMMLGLLVYGVLLSRKLHRCGLQLGLVKKSLRQINATVLLITLSLVMRLLAYIPLLLPRQNNYLQQLNVSNALYYSIQTYIPMTIMMISMMWLQRRVLPANSIVVSPARSTSEDTNSYVEYSVYQCSQSAV